MFVLVAASTRSMRTLLRRRVGKYPRAPGPGCRGGTVRRSPCARRGPLSRGHFDIPNHSTVDDGARSELLSLLTTINDGFTAARRVPGTRWDSSTGVSPSSAEQRLLRSGYGFGMPTPSPSPTVYVLLQQAEQSWWQSWGATVFTVVGSVAASLIVALIALRGVKKSAQDSADSLINAETERAKNAREHEEYRWLRDTRAKAYFGIIASTLASRKAGTNAVWFGRPKNLSSEEYEATNPEGMVELVSVWNAANDETLRWAAELRAIGNRRISTLAERASRFSGRALSDALDASAASARNFAGEPYDHTTVGKKNNARAAKNFTEMVSLIRQELGSDNAGVPEPESLAASSATPRSAA